MFMRCLFAMVLTTTLLMSAANSASASCVDPYECLCGHNTVVRSVDDDTPWIVKVVKVLRASSECPIAVGDELELHQLMDPDPYYEVPNRGLAGSGDPVSSYMAADDAGSRSIPVRPDLPPDKDLIASIHCGEILHSYLIIDGESASCNRTVEQPSDVTPMLPAADALAANTSDDCRAEVAQLLPPVECDDQSVSESTQGCTVAGKSPAAPVLLLGIVGIAVRTRRRD